MLQVQDKVTCARVQGTNDMIGGALLAIGGAHPCRGHQGGDGHMQAESYVPVGVVGQPNAGVQGDDLGSAHQDDVHNEGKGLVLCWRVHVVAVLANHTDCNILHSQGSSLAVKQDLLVICLLLHAVLLQYGVQYDVPWMCSMMCSMMCNTYLAPRYVLTYCSLTMHFRQPIS